MQDFREIKGTDRMSMSREVINNNFISVMTDFSGSMFPTANLYAGMKCNRTDQKKVYVLQDDLATWVLLYSYDNNAIVAQNAVSATAATNDTEGQKISETYIKKIARKSGAIGTLLITQGDGTVNEVALNLTKDDVGLNHVDNTADADKTVSHALTADNATHASNADVAINDNAGQQIDATYIKKLRASNNVITYTKGDNKTGTITVGSTFTANSNITVTASTQTAWSGSPKAAAGSGSVLTRVLGVTAGTYTLQNLLQRLVTISHSHGSQSFGSTGSPVYNCDCDCGDDCGG